MKTIDSSAAGGHPAPPPPRRNGIPSTLPDGAPDSAASPSTATLPATPPISRAARARTWDRRAATASPRFRALPRWLPRNRADWTCIIPTTVGRGPRGCASIRVPSPADVPRTRPCFLAARAPMAGKCPASASANFPARPPRAPPTRTTRSIFGTPSTNNRGATLPAPTSSRCRSTRAIVRPTRPCFHAARAPTAVKCPERVSPRSPARPRWLPPTPADTTSGTPITERPGRPPPARMSVRCPFCPEDVPPTRP
mmetsp:Transcript_34030/g.71597  ORF Transcript_34030/g.71597 Transcript_34030/m.71597 type:complete len:254 (+) Transcript_34030:272-1033(+)